MRIRLTLSSPSSTARLPAAKPTTTVSNSAHREHEDLRDATRQLAQRGMAVLLGGHDPDRGALAAGDLQADGLDVQPVRLDVTDPRASRK